MKVQVDSHDLIRAMAALDILTEQLEKCTVPEVVERAKLQRECYKRLQEELFTCVG